METRQIIDGCNQQRRIVFETAKPGVAVRAQERTDLPLFPERVVMVNSKVDRSAVSLAGRRHFADGAHTVLGREHSVVVGQSDAVLHDAAVANFFLSGKLIFKQFFHVWKWLEIRDKFAGLPACPGMFFARMKMDLHPPDIKSATAVPAGFELPATGAQTDYAIQGIPLRHFGKWASFLQNVISVYRAGFTFAFDSIGAGSVFVEIGSGFDLLAPGAEFIFGCGRRNVFANVLPMTPQLCCNYFLPAETALDGVCA